MASAPSHAATAAADLQRTIAQRIRANEAADKRVFDRLTRLVSALLEAPVSLLMIAEDDQLLYASFVGPDDPWSTITEFPLKDAYCQFAVGARAPFVVEDARNNPLVCNLPPTTTLDVVAYLGVPLLTASGEAIGVLCAIDYEPRSWAEADIGVVEDLAATVMAYLEERPVSPPQSTAGLNIAAVAERTGIGADTLRKWERRYGVLRPRRTQGGQRRYDETDVARVEWLRDRLAEGFRIGEAAALLEADSEGASSSAEDLRKAIVQAVRDPDARRISALVEQAFTLHGVETAVTEIAGPALREVGDRWQDDEEGIAQEHLLSDIVRSRLRRLLDDRRHGIRGTVVLACGPGERHELGLLALAVLLQADGWLAVYLGADAPLDSAGALAAQMGANVLCLSASTSEAAEALERQLDSIELPEALRVAVGGSAVTTLSLDRPVEQLGNDLADAVAALRR